MVSKTKSPLKDKPLRYVAQSGDEALEDLLHDKILLYYLGGCLLVISVIWEWLRFFKPIKTAPTLWTLLAGAGTFFCGYKIYKHISKVKHMKLGRDGERAVGQYLELLREEGCHVFHDILGDGFNVDHVVISDKGIFVCETKTYSKPAKGNASIRFDGQKILINGKESYTDIVTQAQAAAAYLKKVLQDSTGKEFQTFPVVLFPGWYVEGDGNKLGKMWVLEPKAFRKFLNAQQVKISDEDVRLASYHLSRHIRTF